jgi:chemotaxis protein histidine kinase CheA
MPSPSATKANEKQKACKKIMSLLHKDYGKAVPTFGMPVLETMLFAACLEDNSWEAAEQGFERLNTQYFDLNEVRVSSVAEIEETLTGMHNGDWSGLRIRSILRFVFESTYTYDYEKLKRLTQDSAQKRLKKIDNISPFIRNFTVQHSLGGYLVALDSASTQAAIHLGLVPPGSTEEQAGEFLKPGLKKAETFPFTFALRCLATDPRFIERLSEPPDEDEEFNVALVDTRFADLKKPKKKKKKAAPPVEKAAAKKKATKKTPVKKVAARKSTATKGAGATKKSGAPKKATAKAASKKVATAKKKNTARTKAATKSTPAKAAKMASAKSKAVKKKAARKKVASRKK